MLIVVKLISHTVLEKSSIKGAYMLLREVLLRVVKELVPYHEISSLHGNTSS